MSALESQTHWQRAYAEKAEAAVSWYQDEPEPSLSLVLKVAPSRAAPIMDIGGGASRLVDRLVQEGFGDVSLLDVSELALAKARARLPGAPVDWIVADITTWTPHRHFQVWHDRAAFHFMVRAEHRAAYIDRLKQSLPEGGHAIIATFAPDGPPTCSGLPVARYDAPGLCEALGSQFELLQAQRHLHTTPWQASQPFQFAVFRRVS